MLNVQTHHRLAALTLVAALGVLSTFARAAPIVIPSHEPEVPNFQQVDSIGARTESPLHRVRRQGTATSAVPAFLAQCQLCVPNTDCPSIQSGATQWLDIIEPGTDEPAWEYICPSIPEGYLTDAQSQWLMLVEGDLNLKAIICEQYARQPPMSCGQALANDLYYWLLTPPPTQQEAQAFRVYVQKQMWEMIDADVCPWPMHDQTATFASCSPWFGSDTSAAPPTLNGTTPFYAPALAYDPSSLLYYNASIVRNVNVITLTSKATGDTAQAFIPNWFRLLYPSLWNNSTVDIQQLMQAYVDACEAYDLASNQSSALSACLQSAYNFTARSILSPPQTQTAAADLIQQVQNATANLMQEAKVASLPAFLAQCQLCVPNTDCPSIQSGATQWLNIMEPGTDEPAWGYVCPSIPEGYLTDAQSQWLELVEGDLSLKAIICEQYARQPPMSCGQTLANDLYYWLATPPTTQQEADSFSAYVQKQMWEMIDADLCPWPMHDQTAAFASCSGEYGSDIAAAPPSPANSLLASMYAPALAYDPSSLLYYNASIVKSVDVITLTSKATGDTAQAFFPTWFMSLYPYFDIDAWNQNESLELVLQGFIDACEAYDVQYNVSSSEDPSCLQSAYNFLAQAILQPPQNQTAHDELCQQSLNLTANLQYRTKFYFLPQCKVYGPDFTLPSGLVAETGPAPLLIPQYSIPSQEAIWFTELTPMNVPPTWTYYCATPAGFLNDIQRDNYRDMLTIWSKKAMICEQYLRLPHDNCSQTLEDDVKSWLVYSPQTQDDADQIKASLVQQITQSINSYPGLCAWPMRNVNGWADQGCGEGAYSTWDTSAAPEQWGLPEPPLAYNPSPSNTYYNASIVKEVEVITLTSQATGNTAVAYLPFWFQQLYVSWSNAADIQALMQEFLDQCEACNSTQPCLQWAYNATAVTILAPPFNQTMADMYTQVIQNQTANFSVCAQQVAAYESAQSRYQLCESEMENGPPIVGGNIATTCYPPSAFTWEGVLLSAAQLVLMIVTPEVPIGPLATAALMALSVAADFMPGGPAYQLIVGQ